MMTDTEILLRLLELAGAHTKRIEPGISDRFGTTEEVLAKFEAYVEVMRDAPAKTGGTKQKDDA